MSADILGNSRGAIQRQEDGSLELGLGALNLGLGDVDGETSPLTESKVNKVVNLGELVGHKVDTPETREWVSKNRVKSAVQDSPGVAVASGEAHEAVGKAVLVDESAELAAGVGGVAKSLVVVANNGLGDKSGEVVIIAPADTLNSNADVGGRDGVVADSDVGTDEIGPLLGKEVGASLGGLGGEAGEVLLGHLNELLVGDAAGTNKNHAVGGVVALDVVGELGAGDIADVLAGTEDGAAQRLVLVCDGVQVIENNLVQLLLNLLRLAQNDIAFPLNRRLLELRVLENVLQDVDALGNVLVEGLGEVDGVLALGSLLADEVRSVKGWTNRGIGVEVGTHVLDLEL